MGKVDSANAINPAAVTVVAIIDRRTRSVNSGLTYQVAVRTGRKGLARARAIAAGSCES